MDIDIKTQLRILLTLERVSMKKLAELMSTEMNKTYTAAMLYGKINRNSISFDECQHIAKLLGYKIEFVKLGV